MVFYVKHFYSINNSIILWNTFNFYIKHVVATFIFIQLIVLRKADRKGHTLLGPPGVLLFNAGTKILQCNVWCKDNTTRVAYSSISRMDISVVKLIKFKSRQATLSTYEFLSSWHYMIVLYCLYCTSRFCVCLGGGGHIVSWGIWFPVLLCCCF